MLSGSKTSTVASSSSGSSKVHSAQAENVHVRSIVETETQSKVSLENTKKMNDLMSRLNTTHSQIDQYSRKRTEEISVALADSIKKIVTETQVHQQELVADANIRTAEIENDFKFKLQEYISKLDADKAVLLAQLEKDLDVRQDNILESARKRIDDLNEEANRLKMGVLKEAKAQANVNMGQITEQVAALGHEDASRRLASTTTTVITTKAGASGETHVSGSNIKVGTTATHVEASKSASSSSASYSEARR